jgi:hypothetical protein
VNGAARAAVVLRGAVALQLEFAHGEWQFGQVRKSWVDHVCPVEIFRQPPERGRAYQLDLLVRDVYFEAYVDGVWRFTRIIADQPRAGAIGLLAEGGATEFEQLQAWELPAMSHPFP